MNQRFVVPNLLWKRNPALPCSIIMKCASSSYLYPREVMVHVSPVIHDPAGCIFYSDLHHLKLDVKDRGYLAYKPLDPRKNWMEYYHVFIPNAFRGHDIGKVLAESAFDHAEREGWKVKVTCPYLIEKFLSDPAVKLKYEKILLED
jgi:predicted GNAT family acetyltransferase